MNFKKKSKNSKFTAWAAADSVVTAKNWNIKSLEIVYSNSVSKTEVKKLFSTKFYALLKIQPIFPDFGQFSVLNKIVCQVITEVIENSIKKLCSLVPLYTNCLRTKFHGKTLIQSWDMGGGFRDPRLQQTPNTLGQLGLVK